MEEYIGDALAWVNGADRVIWADDIHCGMAEDHDLAGLRILASTMLGQRDEWRSPGPNAREITQESDAA
jgi:S-ribosylhomocysteine lyase